MEKSLQYSAYHSVLRVGAVVVAMVLLFDSGLFSSATARLSQHTQLYLANAVGVYVGVPPNEVNVLTSRISELEEAVAERDRALAIGLSGSASGNTTSTFVLSGILFILLVLIVLNYALDYVRARERYAAQSAV